MRLVLFTFSIIVATTVLNTPTKAQNYPWCAINSDGLSGATNCGFTTFEQCMETARGRGSLCQPNTQHVPPPGPHPHTNLRSYPYCPPTRALPNSSGSFRRNPPRLVL